MSTTSLREEIAPRIRGILSVLMGEVATAQREGKGYTLNEKHVDDLCNLFHARLKALDEALPELLNKQEAKKKFLDVDFPVHAAWGYNEALDDIHQLIQEELSKP